MPIRVFLADDHAVVRDGLQALLESQSLFRVVGHAADGRNTVLQTQDLQPDVVIMDISMPELDGIEATRQIRASCPQTQVIILSMHASSEHLYQAFRAGAQGFVVKEAAGREVVSAIMAVKAGRRFLSRQMSENLAESYLELRLAGQEKSPLEKLSSREKQVLKLVVDGYSSVEIGSKIHLSPKSVDTYRSRLMSKLGVANLVELVKFAIQNGLSAPK